MQVKHIDFFFFYYNKSQEIEKKKQQANDRWNLQTEEHNACQTSPSFDFYSIQTAKEQNQNYPSQYFRDKKHLNDQEKRNTPRNEEKEEKKTHFQLKGEQFLELKEQMQTGHIKRKERKPLTKNQEAASIWH